MELQALTSNVLSGLGGTIALPADSYFQVNGELDHFFDKVLLKGLYKKLTVLYANIF